MTDEQRDCFRIPNMQEHCAIIKIGRKEVRARLVNESASGFAVASGAISRLALGRRVQLRTPSGWSETVVVRRHTENGETVLGLVRLGDLPDPRQGRTSRSTPKCQAEVGGKSSMLSSLLGIFIAFALIFWLLVAGVAWFVEPDGRGTKRFDVPGLIEQAWDLAAQARPSKTVRPVSPEELAQTEAD